MLVLVWLLILMMKMMMKSNAASAEIITAHSGDAVQLTSDQQQLKRRHDVRWTHPHLVMSLKNNVTTCHHGRCELLSDGSLKFRRVQTADSGNYSLEVFDEEGKRLMKKDVMLIVEDISSNMAVVSVVVCCLLVFFLLLFFIIFFILKRRRRNQRMRTAGPLEDNVYVAMHGHHGNKRMDEEEKHESNYVPCNPVVSMETPITEQMSVDAEDIYV